MSLQQEMDGNGLPSIWNGMSKFKVGFENGKNYTFFSKGNFKGEVGQELTYEPKLDQNGQERGTASIVRDYNGGGNKSFSNNGGGYKASKDITISKLACLKASAEFHAGVTASKTDDVVIESASKFFNWIQNG